MSGQRAFERQRSNKSAFCIVIALAVLLVGCSKDETETSTLNRSLAGEFTTLDPHKATTVQASRVLIDLYEGLLRRSADGTIEGGLATAWSISDDGRTYTFELREDLKWSNGEPLTARDFVYSFRRLVTPGVGGYFASFMMPVENAEEILGGQLDPEDLAVRATDDRTLTITLEQPTAYFSQFLTHPSMSPLHATSIREHGESWTRPGNMVSNGAYKLEEQVLGSHVILEKNDQYHDSDAVQIDRVQYFVIVSDDAVYNRYRTGELHITSTVPSSSFARIQEERPEELHLSPAFGLYYYGFNLTNDEIGKNKKLRQALSMAIDREVIADKITARGETPAYSWVPPGVEDYERPEYEWAAWPMSRRIAEARKLYREAGYTDSNPAQFELRFNAGINEQRIAVAIQSMWREALGAEATLHSEEFKVLLSNIRAKDITEIFRLSWVGDYFDPSTFLQLFKSGNEQNLTGYSNPQFDELMDLASTQVDQAKRLEILQEAEALMLADYPAIPIYYYVSKHLVSPKVEGWQDTAVDMHPTRLLSLSDQ